MGGQRENSMLTFESAASKGVTDITEKLYVSSYLQGWNCCANVRLELALLKGGPPSGDP